MEQGESNLVLDEARENIQLQMGRVTGEDSIVVAQRPKTGGMANPLNVMMTDKVEGSSSESIIDHHDTLPPGANHSTALGFERRSAGLEGSFVSDSHSPPWLAAQGHHRLVSSHTPSTIPRSGSTTAGSSRRACGMAWG